MFGGGFLGRPRGGGGAALTASKSTLPAGTAAGAMIAALSQPFGPGTTFVTFGSVPAQLVLDGGTVVAGNGAAVAGERYEIGVMAMSADRKRRVGETLAFVTQSATVTPTPTPTPTIMLSGLLVNGVSSSGIVNNVPVGSAIASNVSGLTVNSSARTYVFDGTGAAGSVANAIRETTSGGATSDNAVMVLPVDAGRLKLSGRQFYRDVQAAAMVLAGYAASSILSATSSDGTALTIGTNSQGFPLLVGVFATSGPKIITISDNQNGTVTTSTFGVMVSDLPAVPSLTRAKAVAAKIRTSRAARKPVIVGDIATRPTITRTTGASPTNGRSFAAGGSTANPLVPEGNTTLAGGGVNSGPVIGDTSNPALRAGITGPSKRFRIPGGRKFDVKTSATGNGYGTQQMRVVYSEDRGVTWMTAQDEVFYWPSAAHYFCVEFPTINDDRVIEVIWGDTMTALGWNFEAGVTPVPFTDTGPKIASWNDSFVFAQGALDVTRDIMPRGIADYVGQQGAGNFGHRTNAYSRVGGTAGVHALVMDRIMSGPYGYDEATAMGRLDVMTFGASINDNALSNFTTNSGANAAPTTRFNNVGGSNSFVPGSTSLYNMLVLCFLRARQAQPDALIAYTLGLHGPGSGQTATIIGAMRDAFARAFDADPLAVMIDAEAGSYRWMGQTVATGDAAPLVPAGANGSSPYFPPESSTFTGATSSSIVQVDGVDTTRCILTVSSTPTVPLQPGMAVNPGGTGRRILKQLTSTPGGIGTYQWEAVVADAAAATMTLYGDDPHPNSTGYVKFAQVQGKGIVTAADLVAAA